MGAERLCLCNGALRSGPSRWKRYTPCLVILFFFASIQFFFVGTSNSITQFVKEKLSSLSYPATRAKPKGPLHILLLSYARTGSSFVGDLLHSIPNSFYYFEPLHFLGNGVINGTFEAGRNLMHKLFTCNVSNIPHFLEWQAKHKVFMKLKRSTSYWKLCSRNNSCYDSDFMDSFCKKSSVVIMKTIRLPVDYAVSLLEQHPDMNLKVIYLIRDPRGTLTSRMKKPITMWCKQDPICINSSKFCSLLSKDVNTSCSLLSTRPKDFMVVRYEDLALFPLETTKELVKFLELPFMPWSVEVFLKTHTSVSGRKLPSVNGLAYSYTTFRNSSITAVKWRQDISFEKLLEFQNQCSYVLPRVGYHRFTSVGALRSNINFDANLSVSLASACSLKQSKVS